MAYWLMKSEPKTYSIDDLERDSNTIWDGVRNYQARNLLMEMQPGDQAFFYHSNTKPPGIVGLAEIIEPKVVDPTQFESDSEYYDPKSMPEDPRWLTVRVQFKAKCSTTIELTQLRAHFTPEDLWILRRGNRLSVVPVEERVAHRILDLAFPNDQRSD